MAWIKKYGPQITFLPSEFLCPGTEHLTNNDGFTALTLWISHTQLEIPNQLKFYGWQTQENTYKQTPLHLWIIYRKQQPLPYDIFYDNWPTKKYGDFLPLHLWIIHRPYEPLPSGILTQDTQQSLLHGQTPIMLWISYRPSEPIPQDLYYDECQYEIDNERLTAALYFLLYCPTQDLPIELYYDQLLNDILYHKHRFSSISTVYHAVKAQFYDKINENPYNYPATPSESSSDA